MYLASLLLCVLPAFVDQPRLLVSFPFPPFVSLSSSPYPRSCPCFCPRRVLYHYPYPGRRFVVAANGPSKHHVLCPHPCPSPYHCPYPCPVPCLPVVSASVHSKHHCLCPYTFVCRPYPSLYPCVCPCLCPCPDPCPYPCPFPSLFLYPMPFLSHYP